jgi:stage II sporulation protein AA (anti-sigma F factor antagonist)
MLAGAASSLIIRGSRSVVDGENTMAMTHEVLNGLLVLQPESRIDSSNATDFEARCATLIAQGPKKVVIDFSNVGYISSAGLRVVLVTAKTVKSQGGALTLCGLRGNVREVMEVSGFDVLLGAHEGISEAATALGT